MKKTKLLSLALATAMVVTSFAGCGSSSDSNTDSNISATTTHEWDGTYDEVQELNVVYFDPISWDQNQCSYTSTATVLGAAYAGLFRIYTNEDGTQELTPDGAESYELSEDELTYTFHIRENYWSDGEAVTAQHYADSMFRALDASEGSPYAFFAFGISNAEEFYNGQANKEDVGIQVVDDSTLVITLEQPDNAFLQKISYQCFLPVRLDVIEAAGDSYATDLSVQVFNGPFIISTHTQDSEMTLVKNEQYWDAENVYLDQINMTYLAEFSTQAQLFEAQQLDVTGASSDYVQKWIDQAATGAFQADINDANGAYYLSFNMNTGGTSGLMNNEKIRLAISLAMNREELCESVYQRYTPAYSFVPPVITSGDTLYRDTVDEQLTSIIEQYSTDEALQELLHEGLAEEGADTEDLSTITFEYLTYGSTATDTTRQEWYRQTIENTLGVSVKVTVLGDFSTWANARDAYEYDFILEGWVGDYNDPMTFLDLFASDSSNSHNGYASEEYDALLAQLDGETDTAKRNEIYQQLEQMLVVDDACIAPLYFSDTRRFTHNYVYGFQTPAFGASYEFRWTYISGKNN